MADSFGFDIVQINGDGNCFFTSVAFQLQQMLASGQCPDEQRFFLNALRITTDNALDELSRILRELIVNEWIVNQNDYQEFFQNIDLQSETERFWRSGEFAGSLGDALPMGMANVLNMPIVSVAPRNSSNPGVIWLSYIQQGAGHYDALVAHPLENLEQMDDTESNEILTDMNMCKYYIPISIIINSFQTEEKRTR